MESSTSQSSSTTATKKRQKNAAKKCHSLKCIRSGHAAASYTANPSILENLEDVPAIEADLCAEELSSSSDGYWVGKRCRGEKATPWTLQELEEHGFTLIAWDGQFIFVRICPNQSC
jgi:hypothetical protein